MTTGKHPARSRWHSTRRWRDRTNLRRVECYLSADVAELLDAAVKNGGWQGRGVLLDALLRECLNTSGTFHGPHGIYRRRPK